MVNRISPSVISDRERPIRLAIRIRCRDRSSCVVGKPSNATGPPCSKPRATGKRRAEVWSPAQPIWRWSNITITLAASVRKKPGKPVLAQRIRRDTGIWRRKRRLFKKIPARHASSDGKKKSPANAGDFLVFVNHAVSSERVIVRLSGRPLFYRRTSFLFPPPSRAPKARANYRR